MAFCGGSASFGHQLGCTEDGGHADPNIFCPSWPPAAILEVPVVMSPLGGMLCVLQNYSQHRLVVCDLERHVVLYAVLFIALILENHRIICSKKKTPWTHSKHTLLESVRTHLRKMKITPRRLMATRESNIAAQIPLGGKGFALHRAAVAVLWRMPCSVLSNLGQQPVHES